MLKIRLPCQHVLDKSRCTALFVSIILIFIAAQGFTNMHKQSNYYSNDTEIIIYIVFVIGIILFIYSLVRCNNIEYSPINL